MEAKDIVNPQPKDIDAAADVRETPTYVVDTHALYWHLSEPEQLGVAADAIFRLAEAGGARLVIPAIVVAEIFYLTKKAGKPLSPEELIDDISQAPGFVLSPLGAAQLRRLDMLDVPEMHDRLIAAEALTHVAPIITRDPALHAADGISAVW